MDRSRNLFHALLFFDLPSKLPVINPENGIRQLDHDLADNPDELLQIFCP